MANIKISELNPLLTVQDADVLPIVDNAVTKKVTAAILRSYTQGNSVLLTGAQTVAGIKTFTSQLASSVATGTAPFSVASTTKVTNLNADLLDGLSSADFQATLSGTGIVKSTAGTISYLTDNTANWDTAYNDKINSAAVTGSGTNTLTLTQQDAGTITATWVNGTLIREVRNTTGATLTKGTIVYISGATGNKPTVTKAIATGDSTSAQTFGFIQSDLANNDNGYVVVVGDLTGVDTSAFAEGAQLYLSSTVAGTFTDVKQYAPAHLVYVGIVTRSHPTLGQIEVNIQNGYELDELHNVSAQSPSNGDILQFVTSTGLWTKIGGTTSAISEGSNLYFTDARSRSAISLTTTGTSGASTYNSTTGVLNIPNYGTALANYLPLAGGTLTGTLNGTTSIMSGVGLNYGFQGLLSAGTGRWNLYMTGTAANHLAGNLLIGGTNLPLNRKISIEGNITGAATAYGIDQFTTISSDVTTSMFSYRSNPSTAAAAFTLPDLYHFFANDAGIGAGSAVTRQYGFYSSIASGTGKWGVYIAGTAANYMNGQLLLGTTTTSAFKLDVNGTARFTSYIAAASGIFSQESGETLQVYQTNATNNTTAIIRQTTAGGNGNQDIGLLVDIQGANNADRIANFRYYDGSTYTSRMAIMRGGNVGIGTISPAAKLEINDASTNSILRISSGTNNSLRGIEWYNNNSTNVYGSIKSDYTSGVFTYDAGNSVYAGVHAFRIGTAGEVMRITSAGNVGIGTTNPNQKLVINQGATGFNQGIPATSGTTQNGIFRLRPSAASYGETLDFGMNVADTYGWIQSTNADNLSVNYALSLNPNGGSVLVGTKVDAGYKLDVNGTARVSADATINGVTVGKGAGSIASNTAVGANALFSNTTGNYNTANGLQSLYYNTTGNYNTAIGLNALRSNTTGNYNTANGTYALRSNTTGSANTANGQDALYSNTTGSNNTAIGRSALLNNLASNNTAVGFEAANANTNAGGLTAIGNQALKNCNAVNNTGIGNQALNANTVGVANTAIGNIALLTNVSGSFNVAIGANQQSTNFDSVSMIGVADTATGSNQMRFGSSTFANGAVTTEVNNSTKVWNVFINGVAQKILLA